MYEHSLGMVHMIKRLCLALLFAVVVGVSGADAQTLADWQRFGAEKSPELPKFPSPAAAATNIAPSSTLSCTAIDATSYEFRLDTVNPPAKVLATASSCSATTGALKASTKYYWRVVPKNAIGTNSGPVWSFTTAAAPQPPTGTASPIGTYVPPAAFVIDAALHKWSLGSSVGAPAGNFQILKDDVPLTGIFGRGLARCSNGLFVQGDDATVVWYDTTTWQVVATADPCPRTLVGALPYAVPVAWDVSIDPRVNGYRVFLDGAYLFSATGLAGSVSVGVAGLHTVAITATVQDPDGSIRQSAPASITFSVATP